MATGGVFRAVVLHAGVFVLSMSGRVDAQTCSISSTTRGPLSCAVTTAITTTIHMPELVSVNVTPVRTSDGWAGGARRAIVDAAFGVSANRSYSLQITNASEDSDSDFARQSNGLSASIANDAPELSKAPGQQATFSGPMGNHVPFVLAFSSRVLDTGTADPIRLLVTIVAP